MTYIYAFLDFWQHNPKALCQPTPCYPEWPWISSWLLSTILKWSGTLFSTSESSTQHPNGSHPNSHQLHERAGIRQCRTETQAMSGTTEEIQQNYPRSIDTFFEQNEWPPMRGSVHDISMVRKFPFSGSPRLTPKSQEVMECLPAEAPQRMTSESLPE